MNSRYILSSGKSEKNDCVPLAFSAASGRSYEEAHKACKKHGRKDRCRFSNAKMLPAMTMIARDLGIEIAHVARSGTLEKFVNSKRYGVFIVRVAGHVLTIVDGHTTEQRRSRRVKNAWLVVGTDEDARLAVASGGGK